MNNIRNFVKTHKPNWPAPTKLIGAGANGRVYELENGRLLKIISGAAHQEYKTLNRLQGLRIAPEFKKGNWWAGHLNNSDYAKMQKLFPGDGYRTDIVTMFIMGKVGGNATPITLWKYLSNPKYKKQIASNLPRIKARIRHLIETMHSKGVSHGNLHQNNILVTVSPSGYITGMWVIDFGRSKEFGTRNTEATLGEIFKGFAPMRSTFKTGNKYTYNVALYKRNGGLARLNTDIGRALYNLKFTTGNLGTWRRRREAVQREIENLPNVSKPRGKSRSVSPRRKSPSPARARSATRWSPPREQRTPPRPLSLPKRKTPAPPKRGLFARLRSVARRGRGKI